MFATKQYPRPFWQAIFLTAAFCLLGFDSARAVTEQPVDYSLAELEELVGPVALYPDDLIGIILPASTYPLQIVEAARYLERHEKNPALQPDEDWDDAVVALLNYPEVIDLLNEDLDWTWNLGEAVVNQQADVLDAIQDFRGRAVTAGNFESDNRQTVTYVDEVIEVSPVDPEVIYVPYYEPSTVVVYQPRPVYHYYPRPYPLYYYPYPVRYSFASGFFWGVTTAYTIGWLTDRVHFHYYGYPSHPYYGHHYAPNYYARHAYRARHYNYARPRSHFVYDRRHYGNTWKPTHRSGHRPRHREARPDRHQTVASNSTRPSRRGDSAGDTRFRSGTERTGDRSSSQRTRKNRSRSGNNQVIDTRSDRRTRVKTDARTTRLNQNSDSRSGSNQIIDTRSKRRSATRSDSRSPRRNSNSGSRSGSNQVIDTRSKQRTNTRSVTSTPRRAGERANTSQRTARATRAENSVRVNKTATRVTGSTVTQRRSKPRAQKQQTQRQVSQAPRSNGRSASTTRPARKSTSTSGNRSKTRVASAKRTTAGRSQSRGSRSGPRRGHRR